VSTGEVKGDLVGATCSEQVFSTEPDDRIRTLLEVLRPDIDVDDSKRATLVALLSPVKQPHRSSRITEWKTS
jgi:hypothetical protein